MTASAKGAACIYVVGMHRSGTSATAGMLAQLGLGMPNDEDLVPADESNERGHFESRSLVRMNNRLFRHFGGTWSIPPLLTPRWQEDASLGELRAEARRSFETSFGPRPIAFKDPRNCISLPFWQEVVGSPAAAVFVFRDPTEVAESLRTRSGLRTIHGLAMWERHLRAAVVNLEGLPTLAGDYAEALADSGAWCRKLVEFLTTVGIEVDRDSMPAAIAFLDRAMRHHEHSTSPGPPESPRRVFDALRERQGSHPSWVAPELGPEPEWVGDVLGLTSELEAVRIAHASLRRSRAFRAASVFWRLRDREPGQ